MYQIWHLSFSGMSVEYINSGEWIQSEVMHACSKRLRGDYIVDYVAFGKN